jgi:cold shock CspA family protein
MAQDPPEYFRGTVVQYDDRAGYGFIQPDDGAPTTEKLLVHRRSLRRPDIVIRTGDRVYFTTTSVPRGLLATDVYAEEAPSPSADRGIGTIARYLHDRGYGFIASRGRSIFFHISQTSLSEPHLAEGQPVSFVVSETPKGPQAFDVTTTESTPTRVPSSDWLAQAILARDSRRYEDAVRLYESGLREDPGVHFFLSYAAMEKNRNRKQAAMRIYELGIERFPQNAKLREDAGILAASIRDYPKALRLLEQSLKLIRKTQQGGEKGVLLALARINYEMDTASSLRASIQYYDQALRLFGLGQTNLPESDLLTMNIASIRTQHHRGNLTVHFFRSARFRIVRARLLDKITEGAEFVVEVDNPELRESYGISRYLLVRCMFKTHVLLSDLDSMDRSVASWSRSGLGDDQVALIVVASLPTELQRLLSVRIDDRKGMLPAIVPIQQTDIETAQTALTAIRASLDRWLYRRDLFAGNSPVEGRRFFGRDKALSELRDAISTSTATGVFGLRKVGKTSLLKETQRRATEWGDIVLYIDLLRVPADVSDSRWLYWKLATELKHQTERVSLKNFKWRLGGVYEDYLDVPPEFPVATAFDADITRLLHTLPQLDVSPKPKVVVLLDEIERLLPTVVGKAGFSGFFDFFSYLRGVSQENKDFVLIVTGANATIGEAAQFERRDNPVFNFFREVYLPLLEFSECALMMKQLGRGMGITFTDAAVSFVHGLTGGHPFFARQLCSLVADQHRERPLLVTDAMVQELADRYLDLRSSDFEEIMERLVRDFPAEFQVCVDLARAGGRLPLDSVRSADSTGRGATLKHLRGYQIADVRGPDLVLTIQLLTEWLQRRYGANLDRVIH